MSCGIELNEEVILGLCHLVECFLANDFDTCVYQEVILFLHLLIFGFEVLDKFSLRIILLHYLKKCIEVFIVAEFANLSIVKGLEGVTIENEVGVQHANDLHFRSILLDFFFLIEELDSLVAQLHEHIVIHDSLHGVVCGDLKCHDLPIAELLTFFSACFERN